MAGTIVNNMTEINDAQSNTGWNANFNTYTFGAREDTTCLGGQVSQGTANAYYTLGTAADLSTHTIHGWVLLWNNPEDLSNGGFGIVVGDGTNRAGFPVGGSDRSGFASTPDGWQLFCLSVQDKDDAAATNLAGTTANITDTTINEIGYYLNATGKALGNSDNAFWDILWYYDHTGYAAEITAGTSASPATFNDLATFDASRAASRALGVLAEIATDVFECTAPFSIGDDGTGSSYFSSTNQEVLFADILNINNHKLAVLGNSTGTNEAFFSSVTFRNTSVEVTPTLNLNGGNINTLDFTGCSFFGVDANFSTAADASGHTVDACVFDGCALLDLGDVIVTNTTFANPSDPLGAIEIKSGTTPGNWSGLNFISDGSGHAVYITTPGTYDFDNWNFGSGFTGTGTDAPVYNNSGGAVTINILNGGNTPTVRNGAGATTTVNASVTVTVTAVDASGSPIENARVLLETSPGGVAIIDKVLTNASGVATASYSGSTPQAVTGRIRKGSTSPFYKSAPITGTISSTGFNQTVTMISDE